MTANTLNHSQVMSRSDFEAWLQTVDLNDKATRAKVNTTVIDEIAGTRYRRSTWKVHGFAPIDTSGTLTARPCPTCVLGANGWEVKYKIEEFCD